MTHDLRFAFRQLGKAPGFSTTVILTLALGIGACTAIFSIVNTTLLNPPDRVSDPDRVVLIRELLPDGRLRRTSTANFLDWKQLSTSFEAVTALNFGRAILTGTAEPLPLIRCSFAEGSQSVRPRKVMLGRWFEESEYQPGKDKVVVLSYEFWQRAYGGDEGILSRTILLDDVPCTVVGVGVQQRGVFPCDVMMPLVLTDQARTNRSARGSDVWASLKPGISLTAAQAEMDAIAAQLAQQFPDANKDCGAKLTSVSELIQRDVGNTLWMLTTAVICVLLIACANVANLQLVRATVRQREISIRGALGADRLRLVRQLLTESLLLALLGGGAGVMLAQWGLAAYNALAPAAILRGHEFHIDGTMLAVALVLSLGTGLLFGLLPAWLASRVDLNQALKGTSRGSTESARGGWLRGAMVATQVACAVVLLAGAGLFLRSFQRLANVDPGFKPERAIGLTLFVRSARSYPTNERQNAFVENVLARMRALPSVDSAGATLQLPINASSPAKFGFAVDDHQTARPRATWPDAAYYTVSPEYFRAAGFRLLRGREFASTDHANAQRVVIINDTLARQHFPNRNPVGESIRLAMNHDGPRIIVGVVSDIKQDGLSQDSICQVYEPNAQGQFVGTSFVVRHTGDAATLIPMLKQQVYAVDKNQPITAVAPLEQLRDANIEKPRFTAELVAIFSVIALAIAAVGIYGVMAYSVSQRTTEIGIRMALGATANGVLRQVLSRGMRIVAIGLGLGLAATMALSQFVASMLYQTSPRDPLALTLITLAIAVVAGVACWLPARRATKVDPITALRAD